MAISPELLKQAEALAKSMEGQFANIGKPIKHEFIDKHIIARTRNLEYWFGVLVEKVGEEIILADAKQMVQCHPNQGTSMVECATFGVTPESMTLAPVSKGWLLVSAMYLCTDTAIESIEQAPVVSR